MMLVVALACSRGAGGAASSRQGAPTADAMRALMDSMTKPPELPSLGQPVVWGANTWRRVEMSFVTCYDDSTTARLYQFMESRDAAASRAYLISHACQVFRRGSRVYVERSGDRDVWIRAEGDTSAYSAPRFVLDLKTSK